MLSRIYPRTLIASRDKKNISRNHAGGKVFKDEGGQDVAKAISDRQAVRADGHRSAKNALYGLVRLEKGFLYAENVLLLGRGNNQRCRRYGIDWSHCKDFQIVKIIQRHTASSSIRRPKNRLKTIFIIDILYRHNILEDDRVTLSNIIHQNLKH